MMIFLDTSAIIAVIDAGDDHHKGAARIWKKVLSGNDTLVTSSYVLVETTALLQSRFGMDAVKTLHNDIVPVLVIEWIGESCHRAGVQAMLTAGRKKLSLVDCTSFEVMRRLGISKAFAFDSHFTELGFETL
jgi:predicted nucleic acid-binding protein